MEKYVYFNSRDTLFRIALSRIVYFEADKNYTNLYLTNGQKLVFTFGLGAMKTYLETSLKTDAQCFVRIGKSLIINPNYVYKIDLLKQSLQLYDEVSGKLFTLSAAKGALRELKELYGINK
ncbi:MAG: LytTR family transcriptional regulator [Tannerella sp.]|jgi:DNA-binding LytR/AlgR family response regulator|nr:LytTR family transcriptional regulator [Tannerella sp.]